MKNKVQSPEVDTKKSQDLSHPTRATKIINKFVIAAMAVIAVGLGIILYWSFQNEQVLQVNNSPFPSRIVQNDDGTNGIVVLTVDYCKHTNVEGQLRVSFVGSEREIFMPIVTERLPKGCTVAEYPFIIPSELSPGKYQIKFRAVYDINPLKKGVVAEFESTSFEIKSQ